MTLTEYQAKAQRTASTELAFDKRLNGLLGLCGEVGECADLLKKFLYQGHDFNAADVIEEAGDVLWYLAELAEGLGVTLEEIAQHNIDKLRKRYPDGFEAARSLHREDEACAKN